MRVKNGELNRDVIVLHQGKAEDTDTAPMSHSPLASAVILRRMLRLPSVAGQWIHPDAALPEEAVALAVNCPSGAITCERLDGGQDEKPPVVNVVRVRENGPLAVHAPLTIAGQDAGLRATLCRCGASKNLLYCDGTNRTNGFKSD